MTDEVTSGEVRTRQFDVVRKGYDRNQVEAFLASVARQIDSDEARLAELTNAKISVGIDDPEALAQELAAIGGEVGAILEAAREAADGMRSRSSEDVEAWQAEAQATIDQALSDASEQSEELRDAAWVEGSALLEASIAEASRILDETEMESLRVRAEAEREAIRYTGDAKRTSEEAIGVAESEAKAIVEGAKSESEAIVAAANQAAELAQERARALEDRRAELLTELETTQNSIGDLEGEIETRRQALEEPLPSFDDEERTHHEPDGGSVRVVSGSKVIPLKPVDADSFVAEVKALRKHRDEEEEAKAPTAKVVATPPADVRTLEPVPSPPPPQEIADITATDEVEREPDVPITAPLVPVPVEPEAESGDSAAPEPSEIEESPEIHDPSDAEPEPTATATKEDTIGSLFAQLKNSQQPTADSGNAPSPSKLTEHPREAGGPEEDGDEVAGSPDSLIPVQNAALRSIKRVLIDLQNDTLEHLRTDENWVPSEDYTDRFGEPFADLAVSITGENADGGAAEVFATDLYDSVSTAIDSARSAGSGDRALAAAASKVFRTWRSDEAERRVLSVAAELAGEPLDV